MLGRRNKWIPDKGYRQRRKRVFCFLFFWIVNFIPWIELLTFIDKRFNGISCVGCRFPIKNYDHDLGQVQPPLHLCAEPNWWIKSGKRAASESVSPSLIGLSGCLDDVIKSSKKSVAIFVSLEPMKKMFEFTSVTCSCKPLDHFSSVPLSRRQITPQRTRGTDALLFVQSN